MDGVSIVIRTLNEKESLASLLAVLAKQDYTGKLEVIVVDNDSSDGTQELAEQSGAHVVTIKRDEFSYPKSMNLGVLHAKYPIVILTVGHALPLKANWIQSATTQFKDPMVAGVYSPPIPHKNCSVSEWFVYWPTYLLAKLRGTHKVTRVHAGVFGATNIALRKELWQQHQFDERYGLGGEDGEWARWALAKGYHLICDPQFVVRHSHHLNFIGIVQQLRYWSKLKYPTRFDRKAHHFRKDLKF